MIILFPVMQDELCEDNFNMSKQPIILREEPDNYNSYRPPNYYGSGRMDEVIVTMDDEDDDHNYDDDRSSRSASPWSTGSPRAASLVTDITWDTRGPATTTPLSQPSTTR